MPEPEDAGVDEIAKLRAWLVEQANATARMRALYESEHARAERLAAENADLRDRAGVYRDWHPCQHTECTTENALRAALAGDAPGRGDT